MLALLAAADAPQPPSVPDIESPLTRSSLPDQCHGKLSGRAVRASTYHQLLGTFTEHWNGSEWTIVNTPRGVSFLAGMAAFSGGTVLAVGQGTNQSGIILSN